MGRGDGLENGEKLFPVATTFFMLAHDFAFSVLAHSRQAHFSRMACIFGILSTMFRATAARSGLARVRGSVTVARH